MSVALKESGERSKYRIKPQLKVKIKFNIISLGKVCSKYFENTPFIPIGQNLEGAQENRNQKLWANKQRKVRADNKKEK